MLRTRRYNFQFPTPTLSATVHSVTDTQTDRDGQTRVLEVMLGTKVLIIE